MSTHQQLLYHVVFSTKNRKPYLSNSQFRESVFSYLAGTCRALEGHALIVGGYIDHAHLLVQIPAKTSVAKFVGRLKASCSKQINDTSNLIYKFGWQDGYGAFTVSPSQQTNVYRYIERQVEHHSTENFESEYVRLLDAHFVEYDPKYIFK